MSCTYTRTSIDGLTPLIDMATGTYEGLTGGKYGDGCNTRPQWLEDLVMAAAAQIQPDADGEICLGFIGDSYTEGLANYFMAAPEVAAVKAPNVRLVELAKSGCALQCQACKTSYPTDNAYWTGTLPQNVLPRLASMGIVPEKIQAVIWQTSTQEFAALSKTFAVRSADWQSLALKVHQKIHTHLPGVRFILALDMPYVGYVAEAAIEPVMGYETGFMWQQYMLNQPQTGELPPIVWGPSIWANGILPRSDGLTYVANALQTLSDYGPVCNHPNDNGHRKVTALVLDHLMTDSATAWWHT